MSSAFPSNSNRANDARDAPTKIFQRRAFLQTDSTPPIPARTVDMSPLGLSVIIDRPLPEGSKATIHVSVVLDDEPRQVGLACWVRSNVLAGMRGFRIWLEFADVDAATSRLIKQMMGTN